MESVKGKNQKLNRLPVFKNRLHIYIVQEILSFVATLLMKDEPSPSQQQKVKKFHSEKAQEDLISKCISLKNHILFCMKNYTMYITCSVFEQDYVDGTTAEV